MVVTWWLHGGYMVGFMVVMIHGYITFVPCSSGRLHGWIYAQGPSCDRVRRKEL